uniref:Putative secreted protein n=1 Tax=Ixodes ricinus TaxID=34613 RepID=A0A6B0V2S7_IXORI
MLSLSGETRCTPFSTFRFSIVGVLAFSLTFRVGGGGTGATRFVTTATCGLGRPLKCAVILVGILVVPYCIRTSSPSSALPSRGDSSVPDSRRLFAASTVALSRTSLLKAVKSRTGFPSTKLSLLLLLFKLELSALSFVPLLLPPLPVGVSTGGGGLADLARRARLEGCFSATWAARYLVGGGMHRLKVASAGATVPVPLPRA